MRRVVCGLGGKGKEIIDGHMSFPLCLLLPTTSIYKAGFKFQIVMRLGELHAWISVDGVELSEFAVEYSADGKEASCWIPSECDKVRMQRPTTLKSYSSFLWAEVFC
jgi:hypothetical protein